MEPPIGNEGDVVIGRDGLEHRNGDGDVVLVLGISLAKLEDIMEEDHLTIDIFDEDVERLGSSVDLRVPLEVGYDREVNAKEGARDWLDLSLKLKLGESVDETMNPSAFLG